MRLLKNSIAHHTAHPFLLVVCVSLLCVSCADLFFPPLEVVSVKHSLQNDDAGKTKITVDAVFSSALNKNALEKAFSLNADGSKVGGALTISGEKVRFVSFDDFNPCAEYVLRITAEAEDARGFSMLNDYVKVLCPRSDLVLPEIAEMNFFYADAGKNDRDYFYILFNKAVTKKSFQKAFSVSPSPSIDFFADFHAAAGGLQEVFVYPASGLQNGKRYTIKISTELCDVSGNALKTDFEWTFVYGKDFISDAYVPLSYQLFLADKDGRPTRLLRKNWNNTNIASNSTLVMQFSKQINLDSLSDFISITPNIHFRVKPDSENKNRAVIQFTEKFGWLKNYRLTIREGIADDYGKTINERAVYDLLCSRPSSRPLSIENAYFEMPDASGKNIFIPVDEKKQYDFISFEPLVFAPGQTVMCNFYVFVELFERESVLLGQLSAAGGDEDVEDKEAFEKIPNGNSIALVNAMQNIKITSSNGAADVAIKNICVKRPEDTPVPGADKIPAKTHAKQVAICASVSIEVRRSNNAGFITFTVQKELCDLIGNSLKEGWVVVKNAKY